MTLLYTFLLCRESVLSAESRIEYTHGTRKFFVRLYWFAWCVQANKLANSRAQLHDCCLHFAKCCIFSDINIIYVFSF